MNPLSVSMPPQKIKSYPSHCIVSSICCKAGSENLIEQTNQAANQPARQAIKPANWFYFLKQAERQLSVVVAWENHNNKSFKKLLKKKKNWQQLCCCLYYYYCCLAVGRQSTKQPTNPASQLAYNSFHSYCFDRLHGVALSVEQSMRKQHFFLSFRNRYTTKIEEKRIVNGPGLDRNRAQIISHVN